MRLEQRQQLFQRGLEELVQRTGITVAARVVPADTPVPVQPPLILVALDGWTPPPEKDPTDVMEDHLYSLVKRMEPELRAVYERYAEADLDLYNQNMVPGIGLRHTLVKPESPDLAPCSDAELREMAMNLTCAATAVSRLAPGSTEAALRTLAGQIEAEIAKREASS